MQAGKPIGVKNTSSCLWVAQVSLKKEKRSSSKPPPKGLPDMCAMEKEFKLLVINPGSTSTKISLFANEKEKEKVAEFRKDHPETGKRNGKRI